MSRRLFFAVSFVFSPAVAFAQSAATPPAPPPAAPTAQSTSPPAANASRGFSTTVRAKAPPKSARSVASPAHFDSSSARLRGRGLDAEPGTGTRSPDESYGRSIGNDSGSLKPTPGS